MFAHCLTAQAAMLVKEVDVNGDWVKAAYSYVDSDNNTVTEDFVTYSLDCDESGEHYFVRYDERYYLSEFHNCYGYSLEESE